MLFYLKYNRINYNNIMFQKLTFNNLDNNTNFFDTNTYLNDYNEEDINNNKINTNEFNYVNYKNNKEVNTGETNDYSYYGLEFLQKNIIINDNFDYKSIKCYIVPYYINSKNPFIQILFQKNKNMIDFINCKVLTNYVINKENIIDTCSLFLNDLILSNFSNSKYNSKDNFKGFYNELIDNIFNIYLFFDISSIEITNILSCNTYFFCILDEILRQNIVYNYLFQDNVIDFFIENTYFLLLKNNNDEICDCPLSLYKCDNYEKIKFFSYFYNEKEETRYGNYYCFTDYKNSLLNSNSYGENETSGIIRCAVFCKNIEVINNNSLKNENEDVIISNQQNHNNQKYENIETFYEINKEKPLWIIKNNDNIITLSYHKVVNII